MSFGKMLIQVSGKYSLSAVFSDFLEMCVCALSMGEREERYLEIVSRYEKADVYKLADAFGSLVIEMNGDGSGLVDPFGDFFMENISHGHNGQFFTPMDLCHMMAQITGIAETVNKTVLDCACGSGRTLLAAAKVNRYNLFYGADVDYTCARMAAVNMCLNGMMGEIAWMNSLTMEWFGGWQITLHEKGVPYLKWITSDESRIFSKLPEVKKKTGPVQQTLFDF